MTEQIEKIIKMFESANVSKLELEIDNIKLKLEKDNTKSNQEFKDNFYKSNFDNNFKNENMNEIDNNKYIKAPVVGTYYAQRNENAKPFIEIGSKVKKGDVLCIIEAMKVMNEVVSSEDGIILDILVKNDDLVQFDQKMIVLGAL